MTNLMEQPLQSQQHSQSQQQNRHHPSASNNHPLMQKMNRHAVSNSKAIPSPEGNRNHGNIHRNTTGGSLLRPQGGSTSYSQMQRAQLVSTDEHLQKSLEEEIASHRVITKAGYQMVYQKFLYGETVERELLRREEAAARERERERERLAREERPREQSLFRVGGRQRIGGRRRIELANSIIKMTQAFSLNGQVPKSGNDKNDSESGDESGSGSSDDAPAAAAATSASNGNNGHLKSSFHEKDKLRDFVPIQRNSSHSSCQRRPQQDNINSYHNGNQNNYQIHKSLSTRLADLKNSLAPGAGMGMGSGAATGNTAGSGRPLSKSLDDKDSFHRHLPSLNPDRLRHYANSDSEIHNPNKIHKSIGNNFQKMMQFHHSKTFGSNDDDVDYFSGIEESLREDDYDCYDCDSRSNANNPNNLIKNLSINNSNSNSNSINLAPRRNFVLTPSELDTLVKAQREYKYAEMQKMMEDSFLQSYRSNYGDDDDNEEGHVPYYDRHDVDTDEDDDASKGGGDDDANHKMTERSLSEEDDAIMKKQILESLQTLHRQQQEQKKQQQQNRRSSHESLKLKDVFDLDDDEDDDDDQEEDQANQKKSKEEGEEQDEDNNGDIMDSIQDSSSCYSSITYDNEFLVENVMPPPLPPTITTINVTENNGRITGNNTNLTTNNFMELIKNKLRLPAARDTHNNHHGRSNDKHRRNHHNNNHQHHKERKIIKEPEPSQKDIMDMTPQELLFETSEYSYADDECAWLPWPESKTSSSRSANEGGADEAGDGRGRRTSRSKPAHTVNCGRQSQTHSCDDEVVSCLSSLDEHGFMPWPVTSGSRSSGSVAAKNALLRNNGRACAA